LLSVVMMVFIIAVTSAASVVLSSRKTFCGFTDDVEEVEVVELEPVEVEGEPVTTVVSVDVTVLVTVVGGAVETCVVVDVALLPPSNGISTADAIATPTMRPPPTFRKVLLEDSPLVCFSLAKLWR
jgi:hypothetical protein